MSGHSELNLFRQLKMVAFLRVIIVENGSVFACNNRCKRWSLWLKLRAAMCLDCSLCSFRTVLSAHCFFWQVFERNSSSRDDEVVETSAMFELQAAAELNANLSSDPLSAIDLSDFFTEDSLRTSLGRSGGVPRGF